jgi:hypothetical protein
MKIGAPAGCFVFFWSFLTLIFDAVISVGAVLGLLALTFQPAPGTITRSDILVKHDSDGDTAQPIVEYDYAVAGVPYHGERHSFTTFSGPVPMARMIADQYRAGDPVTVYYWQAAPAWCVLYRGLTPLDQALLLFIAPFNVVMIGGWLGYWAAWRGKAIGRPVLGLKVYEDGARTTVRFDRISPMAAALVAVLASAFPLTFVCAFGMAFTRWMWLPSVSWGVVIVVAACAWLWARQRRTKLIVDPLRGIVEYLPNDSQQAPLFVPIDQIDIAIGRVETANSEGDMSVSYPVTLTYVDEKSREQRAAPLMTCYDEADANRLREWLKTLFGAPANPSITSTMPLHP